MPDIQPAQPRPIMPKTPIAGPSGPGGSPMVSPGTGAGMQARATDQIKKLMGELLKAAQPFQPGSVEFNAVIGAIKNLNGVFNKKSAEAGVTKPPIPIPPTPPGAGLGGLPPQAAATAAPGGAPPAEAPIE